MYFILYNPLAGNGHGYDRVLHLREMLKDQELMFRDIREVKHFKTFLSGIGDSDSLVLAGGDGTLNKFINFTEGMLCPRNLFYYAVGCWNDFCKDVHHQKNTLIPLSEYIRALPVVTVKGKSYRFLNGVGYGLDGYCCEEGNRLSIHSDKPVNYASVAVKGLLFRYKPTHAAVTVDGTLYEFDQVWLAPTMNGRYYNGGMMISPSQDRLNPRHNLSVVVLHGAGKLKTLAVFPSIFKGEHVRHEDMVTVLTGQKIRVAFDRPIALQVDGETVLGVTEYSVASSATAEKPSEERLMSV